MRRKFICLIIILSIISSLYSEIIVKNIKIKTNNEPKRIGKILCLGKKGVIFWESKIPYNAEFLNDYAEYIPYTEILFIKTKNRLNLYPLLIGVSIGTVSAAGILNSFEDDTSSVFIAGALVYGGFLFGLMDLLLHYLSLDTTNQKNLQKDTQPINLMSCLFQTSHLNSKQYLRNMRNNIVLI